MKTGIELIAAERERQIKEEGWTLEHDDRHNHGQMAGAAACYALQACGFSRPDHIMADRPPAVSAMLWPWADSWWKPSEDPVRNLVKAGALIAAEIDRLQRTAQEDDYVQHGEAGTRTEGMIRDEHGEWKHPAPNVEAHAAAVERPKKGRPSRTKDSDVCSRAAPCCASCLI